MNDPRVVYPSVAHWRWLERVKAEAAAKLGGVPVIELAGDPVNADGTRQWGGQWSALTHLPPRPRAPEETFR